MKREADGEMGSPHKRSRRGDEEVRLLIPSKSAGSIIGKGGANITKLRSQYKASITVPDCPGPERMLTVSSSDLQTVCQIITDVMPNLEQNGRSENEIRMMIHLSQAGSVIGKGGSKIKELRQTTGARIKIFSSCAPQSTDRIIQINGEDFQIIGAINEIFKIIKLAPIKGPVNPYDPHNYDDFYSEEYGGYGSGSGGGGGGEMRRGGGGNPSGAVGGGGAPRGGGGGRGGGRGGGGDRFNNRPPPPSRGPPMNNYNDRGMGGGPPPRSAPFGGPPRGMNGGGGGNNYERNVWGGGNSSNGDGNNYSNQSNQPPPSIMGNIMNKGSNNGGGGGNAGGTSTQVTIPKDLAGAIIGKGGSRIRKIRQDSCAAITIDEPLPGSNDRIITISGLPNQIQLAQYLLQQSVRNNADQRNGY